jgi:hypothetical protein
MTSRVLALTASCGVVVAVFVPEIAGRQGPPPARPQTPAPAALGTITKGDFRFAYDDRGISSLANPEDPFGATVTTPAASGGRGGRGGQGAPAATLGLTLSYRVGERDEWTNYTRGARTPAGADASAVSYTSATGPLKVVETYATDGHVLDWTVDLEATGQAVQVGDLGISIPVQGPTGATPADIFERGFLKHQFVSGAGSFFYYVRASGAPPFLLVTVRPGTKLEYTGAGGGRGGGTVYVHSAKVAGAETRGTWRQPSTALDLTPGRKASYGFRMQWASSYEELRDLIYQAGLFDVRVVPGMTVPTNLNARFSLHTKARIESVTAEFPAQTTSRRCGATLPARMTRASTRSRSRSSARTC